MVRAAFTTFALLAVCRAVGAAPTADTAFVVSTFSFAEWVEGIIADPQGNHLTPKQAIAAFYAGRNDTAASENVRRGPLSKRASCNEQPNTEVPVGDAVSCINYLAAKGQTSCSVSDYSRFCESGQALMDGNSGAPTSSACNDVARAGGFIMDHCTRADNTVEGSEYAYGNGNLLVRIHRA